VAFLWTELRQRSEHFSICGSLVIIFCIKVA
jgi:hypothetical protein